MRLAKRMADAGLCSRRAAEELIRAGVVTVNGTRIHTPATVVQETDLVTVRGKALPSIAAPRLFAFHKPVGMVVSTTDEQNRPTVFDGLPPDLPRLISVGRLDVNSEGLLLLTTSGALARHLELPATQLARTYRVRTFGDLGDEAVAQLNRGVVVDRVRYGPIQVAPDGGVGRNRWWRITLHEGKNREIRRVLSHFGVQVNRLIRLSYGPFGLEDIPKGALIEVPWGRAKKMLPGFDVPCA